MIIQEFNLNMIPDSEPVVVHVNQYDTEDGRFVIHLYNGDTPYTPTNATVLIEGCKPDGNVFAYGPSNGVSISGNTVTAPCLIQMTAVKGRTMTNLIVKENGASTGTFVFWLDVQETPLDRAILSETEIPVIVALAEEQAERAEAWAVGEKNGHPVPDTDPTFDNNAKYWAEQAASSVTGVASFNGRSGSVLPMAGDYNAEQIAYNDTSNVGIELGNLSGAIEAKASKTDLTSIVATGSTNATGSTITKGTLFYLNGVFVKALADIANGATFTIGTNVSQTRVGDELLTPETLVEYTVPSGASISFKQVFNWMFDRIDISKITYSSKLIGTMGTQVSIYSLYTNETSALSFTMNLVRPSSAFLRTVMLQANDSWIKQITVAPNAAITMTDDTNSILPVGYTFKIVSL